LLSRTDRGHFACSRRLRLTCRLSASRKSRASWRIPSARRDRCSELARSRDDGPAAASRRAIGCRQRHACFQRGCSPPEPTGGATRVAARAARRCALAGAASGTEAESRSPA
jgi:hypothetical protein